MSLENKPVAAENQEPTPEVLKAAKLETLKSIISKGDAKDFDQLVEGIDDIKDLSPKEVMVELANSGYQGLVTEKFSDRPDFPSNEIAGSYLAHNDIDGLIFNMDKFPMISRSWLVDKAMENPESVAYILNKSEAMTPDFKNEVYVAAMKSGYPGLVMDRIATAKSFEGVDPVSLIKEALESNKMDSSLDASLVNAIKNANIDNKADLFYESIVNSKLPNPSKSHLIQTLGKYDQWINKEAA